MIFQFHVTSAEANAFVFLCQFMTCASRLANRYIYSTIKLNSNSLLWNSSNKLLMGSEFFWYFIPSFCISSDLTTLHTLSTGVSCHLLSTFFDSNGIFCVEMYDIGVRLVVCVWRPFHVCFACTSEGGGIPIKGICDQWLCYIRAAVILKAADSILQFSTLYSKRGERIGSVTLYYDASIECFSRQYLPFVVLEIIVSCWCFCFHCFSCTPCNHSRDVLVTVIE